MRKEFVSSSSAEKPCNFMDIAALPTTWKERTSVDNGIWLCQTCASLVDRDEQRFTVDILKGWKATAEAAASTEVGKTSQPIQQRLQKDQSNVQAVPVSAELVEAVRRATLEALAPWSAGVRGKVLVDLLVIDQSRKDAPSG
jgi:hypothetical protein